MNLKHFICNDHLVISLSGSFDAPVVEVIRDELQQLAMGYETHVAVDLSEVTFLDSSGIGALVFLFKQLAIEDRNLVLLGAEEQPKRLINLLRIDQVIKSYDNLRDFAHLKATA